MKPEVAPVNSGDIQDPQAVTNAKPRGTDISKADYIKDCVNDHLIHRYAEKTVAECAAVCNSNPDCVAFAVDLNLDDDSRGDCLPQDSHVAMTCAGSHFQLDFYVSQAYSGLDNSVKEGELGPASLPEIPPGSERAQFKTTTTAWFSERQINEREDERPWWAPTTSSLRKGPVPTLFPWKATTTHTMTPEPTTTHTTNLTTQDAIVFKWAHNTTTTEHWHDEVFKATEKPEPTTNTTPTTNKTEAEPEEQHEGLLIPRLVGHATDVLTWMKKIAHVTQKNEMLVEETLAVLQGVVHQARVLLNLLDNVGVAWDKGHGLDRRIPPWSKALVSAIDFVISLCECFLRADDMTVHGATRSTGHYNMVKAMMCPEKFADAAMDVLGSIDDSLSEDPEAFIRPSVQRPPAQVQTPEEVLHGRNPWGIKFQPAQGKLPSDNRN